MTDYRNNSNRFCDRFCGWLCDRISYFVVFQVGGKIVGCDICFTLSHLIVLHKLSYYGGSGVLIVFHSVEALREDVSQLPARSLRVTEIDLKQRKVKGCTHCATKAFDGMCFDLLRIQKLLSQYENWSDTCLYPNIKYGYFYSIKFTFVRHMKAIESRHNTH